MTDLLHVFWGDDAEPTGSIVRDDSGVVAFRYNPGASIHRQLSVSLPVDGGAGAHPITFFENLLPDGVQRERLARRLGVSDASTFAMLRAVGGD